MERMEGMFTISYFLLLVSLLTCVSSEAQRCPTYCTCTDFSLDCENGYVLDAVTLRLLPKGLTSMKLHNFVLRELTGQHVQWFTKLQSLAITDCRTRKIHEDSFRGLALIETIDLQQNHLSELPKHIFANQRNLSSLYLNGNLLERLPEQLLQTNTQLQTLRLSHNRLRLLPSRIFDNLSNLVHLDLSHNELSYILPRTFSFISVVRYIDLSDNLLVTIHEDLFDSNNITVDTKLSVAANPLDCNCGLIWLQEALKGQLPHLELFNATKVICANPRIYQRKRLSQVPLEQLNCTSPTVSLKDTSPNYFHGNKVRLECHATGSPFPSIVWKTPLNDYVSDPYKGEWIDGSITSTYAEKKYQIYATGEMVHFTVKSVSRYSVLSVDSLHLVSSGPYQCIAFSPGGNATATVNVTVVSSVEPNFYPSLVVGSFTLLIGILIGVVGCSVTACIDKCSCCESMSIKYYDGSWMNCHLKEAHNSNANVDDELSEEDEYSSSDEDADEDDDLLGAAATASISSGEPSSSSQACVSEINEHTALTADVWDAYFREYPDDFVVESFDASPKKFGSPQHSARGSPTHRSHGKTLETLEGVRVRLKLRVEQIDVMKERLRIHMEKRSARMKENIERKKVRMNKKMQTIKESTSQSLQSIRETGRNYSHKLHMGVRTAMENVGAQVQSLKEFCGTGDLGQTLSIATITTDIDTNETTELTRSVTMV